MLKCNDRIKLFYITSHIIVFFRNCKIFLCIEYWVGFFYWSIIERCYGRTMKVISLRFFLQGFWWWKWDFYDISHMVIELILFCRKEKCLKEVEFHDDSSMTQLLNNVWTKITSVKQSNLNVIQSQAKVTLLILNGRN